MVKEVDVPKRMKAIWQVNIMAIRRARPRPYMLNLTISDGRGYSHSFIHSSIQMQNADRETLLYIHNRTNQSISI